MARTTRQSGLNREAAGAPGDALNVEMRIPEDVKRETERLRHRLKIISTHLARLDPQQDAHLELLEATVELNMVFGDFVDHWLRARIEPIERSFNEQFKNRESATIADKQATSKWANAELRTHGLAIRCPKTRRASILLADPGNHPAIGRFQLQHKAMDGRWKRSLSTPNLPYLKLMPDLPSLDVNLAHVLGRIDGAETVASATA